MEFKKFMVGDTAFGQSKCQMKPMEGVTNVNFVSPQLQALLEDPAHRDSKERAQVCKFMLFMSLCHTVLVETAPNGKKNYNAASPDELALVNAAKYFGFELSGRDDDGNPIIKHEETETTYKLLNVLEFNSQRKRMSVVLRFPDGRIRLLCKGADNVICERLAENSNKYRQDVEQFLQDCGNEGLRTLAYAQRVIPESEYEEWNRRFQSASAALYHREEKMDAEAEKLEVNMKLVGATAIEDKLQDEVGETIHFMRAAGIRIWMLTGDKAETAINIAYSCSLLTSQSIRTLIDAKEYEKVLIQLRNAERVVYPLCAHEK